MSRPVLIAAALSFVLAGLLPLQAPAQQRGASGPVAAGYTVVESAKVPVTLTLTGRAVAQNTTRVRPRVGGAITALLYTPGAAVQAGDPLFSIDPLTYEVALASAEASLRQVQADLTSAQTAYDRAERLRETNTASVAALDDAQAALLKAQAAMAAAEAERDLARAQLDWTTIRAPIAGIAGLPQVSVGDLVTQNQSDALVEIVQIDPVQVDVTEPWPLRLKIEARAAAGEVALSDPKLTLLLDDGQRVSGTARLVSAGATVSATTGTRVLRFELPNPQGLIAPGMFLHAELQLGTETGVLVPQRATGRERDGSLFAWVAVDGKAEKRKLTETGTAGNAWIVKAGLQPGEWLLLDGTANLREGQEVAPVPAVIDETGVVRDAGPAPAPGN